TQMKRGDLCAEESAGYAVSPKSYIRSSTAAITLASQLHLSNPRCLAHSFGRALPSERREIPTLLRPSNIADVKAACRDITVLARHYSLRSAVVPSTPR